MAGNQQESGNLDNLPPTGSKFWDKARTQTIEIVQPPECEHEFRRVNGREVECMNCHAGFVLEPGWDVKNGHIYKGKKRVL